jgi:hypothetical protein
MLLGFHLVFQFINLIIFDHSNLYAFEISNRFDFDDELSIPTWFSQFLFICISGLAFMAAFLETNKQLRRLWAVIGVVGLLVSIDEVASIHENILQFLHLLVFKDAEASFFANAWILILPAVLALSGYFLYKVYRLLPKQLLKQFAIAIAVFIIGAVFVDIITSTITAPDFVKQGILVGIEELFEVLSAIIIIYAISNYIEHTLLKNKRLEVVTTKK